MDQGKSATKMTATTEMEAKKEAKKLAPLSVAMVVGGPAHPSQSATGLQKADKRKETSSSSSQGGDYQQHMQGAGSQGGSSAGADYQQYMDYSKYTQGAGAGGSSAGGDYKQYMDYQKYMQGAGAGGKSTQLVAEADDSKTSSQ